MTLFIWVFIVRQSTILGFFAFKWVKYACIYVAGKNVRCLLFDLHILILADSKDTGDTVR